MKLTEEERAILSHVVVDPDAWCAHAELVFGAERAVIAMQDKVARWKPSYDEATKQQGYKARAQRTEQEAALLK